MIQATYEFEELEFWMESLKHKLRFQLDELQEFKEELSGMLDEQFLLYTLFDYYSPLVHLAEIQRLLGRPIGSVVFKGMLSKPLQLSFVFRSQSRWMEQYDVP